MRIRADLVLFKAAAVVALALSGAALSQQQQTAPPPVLEGKVVSISDGDTLTLLVGRDQVKVRLHGIDSPEKGQPWSDRAKQFTAEAAHGRFIRVEVRDRDRYGRTVGEAWVGRESLNAALVANGFAWAY